MRLDLLVFVEGSTEEQYLTHWHRAFRDRVSIEIDDFRGVPMPMVQRAAAAKRRAEQEERKGRGRAYDQVWCVFDRDDHPNVSAALDMARRHDVHIAFSNPCLELWFLLHFQQQTAYIDQRAAQRIAEQQLGFSKNPTGAALATLFDRYRDAKQRAIDLDAKHDGDGSPRESNPSSGVWRLVEAIRTA